MGNKDSVLSQPELKVLHIDDEDTFLDLFRSRVERTDREIEIKSIKIGRAHV